MVYAHVIYKKTGLERKNVTPKSYNLLKNQYTLLGYVDENGNPVAGPEEQSRTVQKKREVKSAGPVEVRKKMTPEEIEAKKAELQEMNRVVIQKALDEQAKQEAEKKVQAAIENPKVDSQVAIDAITQVTRKKPGPKPKIHA